MRGLGPPTCSAGGRLILKNNNPSYNLIYSLSQKYVANIFVLEYILLLVQNLSNLKFGSVYQHSNKNNYEIRISNKEMCASLNYYFNKFPLKTNKYIEYLRWISFIDTFLNPQLLNKKNVLIMKYQEIRENSWYLKNKEKKDNKDVNFD